MRKGKGRRVQRGKGECEGGKGEECGANEDEAEAEVVHVPPCSPFRSHW